MTSETMADERSFMLNISESFFRLMTESVRLFSNKQLRCSNISEVVNERATAADSIGSHYRPNSINEHLRIIPTGGDIGIELTILKTSAAVIDEAIPDLERLIGASLSFASAVSIILFDFIVEENRTEIINKLGLNLEDAEAFRKAANRTATNVISFR